MVTLKFCLLTHKICLLTLIDMHLYILIARLRNTEMVSHFSLEWIQVWHSEHILVGCALAHKNGSYVRAQPAKRGVLRTGLV